MSGLLDCFVYFFTLPCIVRVMDCSNFSSSSVRDNGRWACEGWRDMMVSLKFNCTIESKDESLQSRPSL